VLGPTLMFDVPGFLNASLLMLWESNAPYSTFTGVQTKRHRYDTHPMINLAWGIPVGQLGVPVSVEGYANYSASKGRDEFGGGTRPETNIDMQLMCDVRRAWDPRGLANPAKILPVRVCREWTGPATRRVDAG